MFCPEGYVSLYESLGEFDSLAQSWWEHTGKAVQTTEREKLEQSGKNPSEIVDASISYWLSCEAYRKWAMPVFMHRIRETLCVASPDGRIMRLGYFAFEEVKYYVGPFPETFKAQTALIEHLSGGFHHLTADYFTILPNTNGEAIYSLSPEFEASVLSRFEGWAVCWKPKDFNNWRSELRTLLGEGGQSAPTHHHRPANERRTSEQIVALFDQDDQITKAKCREQGVGIGLGTLAFDRAWTKAGESRPALLAQGRRRAKSPDFSKPQIQTPI